jgi:hypothetical protein
MFYSNPNFLGEIWASLLSDLLDLFFAKRPTRSISQALHRRSPCIRYSWRFIPLDGLDCPGVTKVVADPGKFVLPSLLWGFDCGSWTRFWWSFRVDYGWKRLDSLWAPQQRRRHLLWWPNFGKKSCVFVSLILIYFMFLFRFCSCLELDLILEFSLLLVVPVISLSSILSSLLIVNLSGPRRIILVPDLLFHYMKFLMTKHIQPPNQTYLVLQF